MLPVIELQGIGKRYRSLQWFRLGRPALPGKEALNDISFSVHPGEICGLLGLNGAGKTTLIKILATLILPDGGSGRVGGCDLVSDPGRIRAMIGHVNTNDRSFYWRLSVRRNLEFFAALYGFRGRARVRRVAELLELVDLVDQADNRFATCSAGQKQRVAIARALLAEPEVILLDEPTSSLDLLSASRLRSFVREELIGSSGKAALWSTHNLQEAQEVCDRIVVLDRGRLVANLTAAEIEQQVRQQTVFCLDLGGDMARLPDSLKAQGAGREDRDGREVVEIQAGEEEIPGVIADLTQRGIGVYGCSRHQPDLEALFADIVGGTES